MSQPKIQKSRAKSDAKKPRKPRNESRKPKIPKNQRNFAKFNLRAKMAKTNTEQIPLTRLRCVEKYQRENENKNKNRKNNNKTTTKPKSQKEKQIVWISRRNYEK